jgi:transposase
MNKTFRAYHLDQSFLLPPDLREWLPEDHLALFVADVVANLDLSEIYRSYEGDGRGQPPYAPKMMVSLLVYAYCTGRPSSRGIERATYEDVAFRVLAANQHPDHATIAEFRRRHLKALAGLFLQVLALCRQAGLVKLGHVALDGTKVKANASKHKAMSYGRMLDREAELKREIDQLLRQAEETDRREDDAYGKERRGDELPEELRRRESRLAKIQEARAALEQQARDEAAAKAEEVRKKLAEREEEEARTGRKKPGRRPKIPDPSEARPQAKAQRNFTDPDSRIMLDGATKSFVQAYNVQAVVDDEAQIIVATGVTQEANDKRQLVPMLERAKQNLGQAPPCVSADAGYFSEEAVTDECLAGIDLYVSPGKEGDLAAPETAAAGKGAETADSSVTDLMRHKLRTPAGQALYKRRKAIVEPVFGQTKEVRGFRQFQLRGAERVTCEWDLICMAHNLGKLHRAGQASPRTMSRTQ